MKVCKVVGEDFMLATAADIVADPSAPDAFVQELWKEKSGFGKEESFVNNLQKELRRELILSLIKKLEEHKLRLFNNFLSNL